MIAAEIITDSLNPFGDRLTNTALLYILEHKANIVVSLAELDDCYTKIDFTDPIYEKWKQADNLLLENT